MPGRGKPFQKGADARRNPGGSRGRTLAALARARTKDGHALVEFFWDVLTAKETSTSISDEGEEVEVAPTIKERMEAAKFLKECAFGRSWTAEPDAEEEEEDESTNLSDEQLVARLTAVPPPPKSDP